MNTALECLTAPVRQEDFYAHYWGQEFLVARQSTDWCLALFSWAALNEILSTQRFDFPRLRLVRSGRVIPSEQYIVSSLDRRGRPYNTHNSTAVADLLASGCVLHITSVGEAWKPLATFAAQLERELGARVQVNVHAGFAASRGFDVHWDGHEVFAVQLQGRKKWRLFGFTEEAPLAVPPDEKRGAPTNSTWEGILSAGDILYMSRGYWHAAEALEDVSLHLTFAAQPPTGHDFLSSIFRALANSTLVRKNMPCAEFAVANGRSAKDEYLSGIRAAISNALSTQALDQFVAEYAAGLGRTNHIDVLSRGKKE